MSFLPKDFIVPTLFETDRFRLRMLTVNDVVKDYDAVMSSRQHLWSMFGEAWRWPTEKLTLEQDLIDLGWHQKEFQLRSSFAYTVVSLDESRVLGCVYVDRSSNPNYDASVCLWARQDELATGLDGALFAAVKEWIAQSWHFDRVAYPGRELSWQELSGYDPAQAVLAAEQAWTQAHLNGDFAAIEQMMAEAYTRINPDGTVSHKAEVLASYQPQSRQWEFARSDQHEVLLNGDTATVIGRWTARGINNGARFDYQARFLSVYVQRKGRWLMLAEQSAEIK